ncbi:MAG: hypothetical protein IJZ75_01435 [Clostridia bacterium]|nr:hypothetical protein [Clostridia bacterium]
MENLDNKQPAEQKTKRKDILLAVIITEMVCVALILVGVLLLKYLSAENFNEALSFYSEYFLTETTVSEVINI